MIIIRNCFFILLVTYICGCNDLKARQTVECSIVGHNLFQPNVRIARVSVKQRLFLAGGKLFYQNTDNEIEIVNIDSDHTEAIALPEESRGEQCLILDASGESIFMSCPDQGLLMGTVGEERAIHWKSAEYVMSYSGEITNFGCLALGGGGFTLFDSETGKTLWSWRDIKDKENSDIVYSAERFSVNSGIITYGIGRRFLSDGSLWIAFSYDDVLNYYDNVEVLGFCESTDRVYVLVNDDNSMQYAKLACFDREDGKMFWEKAVYSPASSLPAVLFEHYKDSVVLVMKDSCYLFSSTDGSSNQEIDNLELLNMPIWDRLSAPPHLIRTAEIRAGSLYVASNRMIVSISLNSGDIKWMQNFHDSVSESLCFWHGYLVVLLDGGTTLELIDIETGKINEARFSIPVQPKRLSLDVGNNVVYGNTLFLAGSDGNLYALALPIAVTKE